MGNKNSGSAVISGRGSESAGGGRLSRNTDTAKSVIRYVKPAEEMEPQSSAPRRTQKRSTVSESHSRKVGGQGAN